MKTVTTKKRVTQAVKLMKAAKGTRCSEACRNANERLIQPYVEVCAISRCVWCGEQVDRDAGRKTVFCFDCHAFRTLLVHTRAHLRRWSKTPIGPARTHALTQAASCIRKHRITLEDLRRI